jgi:hypothetical protein
VLSLVFGLVPVALMVLAITMVSSPWLGGQAFGLVFIAIYLIAGILALILGNLGCNKVSWSQRAVKGYHMAKTGKWLGIIFGGIIPVLCFFTIPSYDGLTEKGNITRSVSHCKQILLAMKIYASDHDGHYPDLTLPNGGNSNEVFRVLFKDGWFSDEYMFGGPKSPFIPDNNIGTAPDFSEALKAGENHWAMTKGQNDSSSGDIPVVFENPSEATWPPKWDASVGGKAKPGRAWKDGRIVIGFNNGSVSAMKLESAFGKSVGLKPNAKGEPVFPDISPKPEILNVAK